MANVKNLARVQLKMKTTFQRVISNKSALNEIGEMSVDRIKIFARKGTPIQGKKVGRFPSGYPSKATVISRKQLAKYNKTHPAYGARNKNLTITGQLVDAVKFKLSTTRIGFIDIFIDGRRKPYKTGRKSTAKNTPTNDVLYGLLLDKNKKFEFLGMDDKGQKLAKRIILKYLRRSLKVQNLLR